MYLNEVWLVLASARAVALLRKNPVVRAVKLSADRAQRAPLQSKA